jgi:hypothetical protein
MDTVNQNSAVTSLIAEIERGVVIVSSMSDKGYAQPRSGESSIGAHIRHNLDFINALLNGVDIGRVDYNARSRDIRIESDRHYAIEQMQAACRRLRWLGSSGIGSLVSVRSEISEGLWHASSVPREIEFLHSHTIHHYALVRWLMDRTADSADSSFGVSPSTLRFRSAVSLAR